MGNEPPKKGQQQKTLDQIKLDIACLKVKAYLELNRDRRINDALKKETALAKQIGSPSRIRVDEFQKLSALAIDVNFIEACNLIIRCSDVVKSQSIRVCQSKGDPNKIPDLMPFLESILWSSQHLNLQSVKEFSDLIIWFFGAQMYDSSKLIAVDPELKELFKNPIPDAIQVNMYAIKFAEKYGFTVEQLNAPGHRFGPQYLPENQPTNPDVPPPIPNNINLNIQLDPYNPNQNQNINIQIPFNNQQPQVYIPNQPGNPYQNIGAPGFQYPNHPQIGNQYQQEGGYPPNQPFNQARYPANINQVGYPSNQGGFPQQQLPNNQGGYSFTQQPSNQSSFQQLPGNQSLPNNQNQTGYPYPQLPGNHGETPSQLNTQGSFQSLPNNNQNQNQGGYPYPQLPSNQSNQGGFQQQPNNQGGYLQPPNNQGVFPQQNQQQSATLPKNQGEQQFKPLPGNFVPSQSPNNQLGNQSGNPNGNQLGNPMGGDDLDDLEARFQRLKNGL